MSRDLNEIFDLARLRRAWGDTSAAGAAVPTPAPVPAAAAGATTGLRPLRMLDQLGEALESEFPSHMTGLRYHLDLVRGRLQVLLGEGTATALSPEEAAVCHAELQAHLDQLEDLMDALSLTAKAAG